MITVSRTLLLAAFAAATLAAQPASAQTKWNLPAAYPADNPHSENLALFAKDVADATGGKLQITVHPAASLFKAPEIKRAVQTGQAQIGEVLISLHENEDPIFGVDVVPFLATSFAEFEEALAGLEAGHREEARRAGADAAVRGAVGAAGHLRQEGDQFGRRHEGPQVARLQCRHRPHRRTGRRAVGDRAGGRIGAGAGDRRGQFVHDLGGDRLRQQGLGVDGVFLRHAGLDPEEHHLRQQGGVRRARQADARGAAQGGGHGGNARLEDVAGKSGWYPTNSRRMA